jgi:hypothetical protein
VQVDLASQEHKIKAIRPSFRQLHFLPEHPAAWDKVESQAAAQQLPSGNTIGPIFEVSRGAIARRARARGECDNRKPRVAAECVEPPQSTAQPIWGWRPNTAANYGYEL